MAVHTEGVIRGADHGGLLNEDVMQKIWDISRIPLPFTDRIASDKAMQSHTEWTQDELASPDPTLSENAMADGATTNTLNHAVVGVRVGNHCQITVRVVNVSTRARETDTIGRADELAYQVMRRQQDARRAVESVMLYPQGSKADDGAGTGGLAGGFPSWLETNVVSTGTDGGFNLSTGLVDAPIPGTATALSESAIRDVVQSVYEQGGEPSILMSVPAVCRKLSEFMFSGAARIATLQSDQGKSREKAAALGAVNVFVTDFATLEFVPNRLQALYNSDANADVLIIDPQYVRIAYLHGYRTEPLAKTGLSDLRQIVVDWTLKVLTEKAHGKIADVDPTANVVA